MTLRTRSRLSRWPNVLAVALLVGLGSAALAQDLPVINSIESPFGRTRGAHSPGSFLLIRGSNLHDGAAAAAGFPLPLDIGGVYVELSTAGSYASRAPLHSLAEDGILALLPNDTPIGEVFVTVVNQGGARSEPFAAKVTAATPTLLTRWLIWSGEEVDADGGWPFAVAQHKFGDVLALNSPVETVEAGQSLSLWVSGLGRGPTPVELAPSSGPLSASLRVFIGHRESEIEFAGQPGCCAGIQQVNVQVPLETPTGCLIPVWIEAFGGITSPVAHIAVASQGERCDGYEASRPEGIVASFEFESRVSPAEAGATDPLVFDLWRSRFYRAGAPVLDLPIPLILLPSPGLCARPTAAGPFPILVAAAAGRGQAPRGQIIQSPSFVDAGETLTLRTPAREITATRETSLWGFGSDWCVAATNGQTPFVLGLLCDSLRSPFLTGGGYRLSSEGGEDVSAFELDFERPNTPELTVERSPAASQGPDLFARFDWPVNREPDALRLQLLPPASNGEEVDDREERIECVLGPGANASVDLPEAYFAHSNVDSLLVRWTATYAAPVEIEGVATAVITHGYEDSRQTLDLGPARLAQTPVYLPDGELILAELATTAAERSRGLMNRQSLATGRGMLFQFAAPASHSFWMFQTLIPLDIIWLNADKEILFINANTPPCEAALCPTYGGQVASTWVLELAAGEAEKRGLQVGARLDW